MSIKARNAINIYHLGDLIQIIPRDCDCSPAFILKHRLDAPGIIIERRNYTYAIAFSDVVIELYYSEFQLVPSSYYDPNSVRKAL